MAANTSPIFSLTPQIGVGAATAANTVGDGGGTIATDIFKVFTAGADGAWVSRIRFQAASSAAATNTTATVARVFVSSITSGATTNANTFLIAEVGLGVVAADHSTNATNPVDIQLNFALPASWTILITNHAAPAANTRWMATVYAGNY